MISSLDNGLCFCDVRCIHVSLPVNSLKFVVNDIVYISWNFKNYRVECFILLLH